MPFLVAIVICLVLVLAWQIVKIRKNNSENEHLRQQLFAVSQDYISLHEFDLKNDCFYTIKSNPIIEGFMQGLRKNIQFQIQNVMKGMATEGSRDSILAFVDTHTLLERMEGHDVIYCDFEGVKSGWCRAEFLWLSKEEGTVLFGVRTIDEDKTREDSLRFLAEKDVLTGVFNAERGKVLVSNAMQRNDRGMLCLVEIDDFKRINDEVGSAKGDQLIRELAKQIQGALGSDAIVYRRGGARFSAFLKDVDDKNEARYVLNKVVEGSDLSLSIGVAFHRSQEATSIEQLIANAESSLATSRAVAGVSVSYYD